MTYMIYRMWNRIRVCTVYSKYPKILNTKVYDRMQYANSADPDQTAPEGTI